MTQQHLQHENAQASTACPSAALSRQSAEEDATPNAVTSNQVTPNQEVTYHQVTSNHVTSNQVIRGTGTSVDHSMHATPSALTTLLRHEARLRRRANREYVALVGGFLAAMAWMVNRLFADPARLFTNVAICFTLLLSLGAGMFLHIARRSYRRKRALIDALSRPHHIEQVGELIQTLRVENTLVRNLAKHALIKLLPELKASDATKLGNAERDILLRQLSISPKEIGYRDLTELFSWSATKRELEFRIAILKALEQIGGAKELSLVSRLARGLPTSNSAFVVSPEVRRAAQECLPYLEERSTAQLASRQLLRASSADAAPVGDVLLRPVAAYQDTPAEQLLRASEPRM